MPAPDLDNINALRNALANSDGELTRLSRELEALRRQRAAAGRGGSSADAARTASAEAAARQLYMHHASERSRLAARLSDAVGGWMIERPEDSVATLERALPVVLLPVRLETRFIGSELRIRIYPDQIHVYQHDPELTHDEVAAASRYWQAVWSDASATEQAWRELLDRAKPERAAWLVDALRPTNLANRAGAANAEFPDLLSVERRAMRPALARLLPSRWAVTLVAHDGKRMARKWAKHAVAEPLCVSPFGLSPGDEVADAADMPPGVDAAARWMFDFDAAVEAGMALTIDESELEHGRFADGIGSVIATGVDWSRTPEDAAALLADQLRAHGYTDGFEFLEHGHVTNNTAQVSSGYDSDGSRRGARFTPESPGQAKPQSVAARLGELLGVDGASFARFPGAGSTYEVTVSRLHAALYGAAFGFYFTEVLYPVIPRGQFANLRDHVQRFLRPAGPYAAIRVGKQPYGVLPVLATPISLGATAAIDAMPPGFLRSLATVLARIRVWLDVGSQGLHVIDKVLSLSGLPAGVEPEAALADMLKQSPIATGTFVRPIGGTESVFLSNSDIEASRIAHENVVTNVLVGVAGGTTAGLYTFDDGTVARPRIFELYSPARPRYSLRSLPWVTPDPASNKTVVDAVAHVKERLDAAASDPDKTRRFLAVSASDASTLFEALLLLSAAFEYWKAAEDESRRPEYEAKFIDTLAPQFTGIEPQVAPSAAAFTMVSTPRQLLQIATPGSGGPPVSLLADIHNQVSLLTGPRLRDAREFHAGMNGLLECPVKEIDHALRGLLDSGSHRLDAWITSVATRRLHSQRASRPQGVHIGGFGFVHDLRPDIAPTSEGFVHVPSADHAVMSAVLRAANMANRDDKPDAFAVKLTSRRVREAMYVSQGMAQGQRPGALLGYRFERRLVDSRTEARFINAFRKLAPQPDVVVTSGPSESIAARDVVEGLRLAELWRKHGQQLFVQVGALTVPPMPIDAAQAQALTRHLDYLIDLVDSFSDLWTAESVFQLVRGNREGEAAALGVLDRQERPPEVQCVQTPRKSWGYSQRVMCARPVAAVAPEWPEDLASRTEPGANQLAATWLGDPRRFRFAAQVVAADGLVFADRVVPPLGAGELGLSPLSTVMQAARAGGAPESRLRKHVEQLFAARVDPPAGARVVLRDDPPADARADVRGFAEFAALANAIRVALFDRVALSQRDFAPPTGLVDARVDVDAVSARAAALEQELVDCATEVGAALDAAPDRARLLACLARASQFLALDAATTLERIIEQCRNAQVRIMRLLEQWRAIPVPPPITGSRAAEAAQQRALDRALKQIRIVFGSGFPVLPPFALDAAVVQEWQLNFAAQKALFEDRSKLAAVQWVRTLSQVRSGVRAMARALDAAAWSGHPTAVGAMRVAQFPNRGNDAWVALPFASDPPTHVRMSALMIGELATPDTPMVGVLLDEWTEAIPESSTTTSVAFHHDAPGARAPQTLCVAVDAGATAGGWSIDSLVDTVQEMIDLSKIRLLKPDQIPGAGAMLPTMFIPHNLSAEMPSLDLLGLSVHSRNLAHAIEHVFGKE